MFGFRGKSVRINLALQGGGAHGAFTWGVIDRLLDESASSSRGSALRAPARSMPWRLRQRPCRGRQGGCARQAAQCLGRSARGGRARSFAAEPLPLRHEPVGTHGSGREPLLSLRVQSAGLRSAAPAAHLAHRFRQVARVCRHRASDRSHRRGNGTRAPVSQAGDERRGGARLRLPADRPSCGRDRRPCLLGRRVSRPIRTS